jgi:non-heme chloroperoxidase
MSSIKVGQENSGPIKLYYEDHGTGLPCCPDPRLPAQWPCLGQAGPSVTGGRPSRHHVRPARVRQIQPAGMRLRLRHLRQRLAHTHGKPGPAQCDSRRSLDGNRRSYPLSEPLRLGAGCQGSAGSPIPPFLLQTEDNPDGVPASLFEGFVQAARQDTPAGMKGFLDNFSARTPSRGPTPIRSTVPC